MIKGKSVGSFALISTDNPSNQFQVRHLVVTLGGFLQFNELQ